MATVKVRNESSNPLPQYQTPGSAGMDLTANLETEVELLPGQTFLVPTGIYIEMSTDMEAQVRPRSGLALKHGITVLNSPGTIDSDYRGEIKVILINHSQTPFVIKHGERIAQMVFAKVEQISWEESITLSETERGTGGYGHTGK